MPGTRRYAFGPFELDAGQGVLRRDGQPVHLAPKSVGVLLVLVEHHGELVDKTRIFDLVWPGVTVEECNLAQHVASLRRLLGDDARGPSYIETVSRRGYRFVAGVTVREAPAGGPAPAAAPHASPAPADPPPPFLPEAAAAIPPPRDPPPGPVRRRSGRALAATLALAFGAALVAASMVAAASRETTRSVALLPVANLTGDPRNLHLATLLGDALHQELDHVTGLRIEHRAAKREGLPAPVPEAGAPHPGGVDAIIESALIAAGDRVQIVVELIEASSDALIWADVLEADGAGLRGLENQMAQAVLSRLRLNRADRMRPMSGKAAARREHALARYYLSRRTPQVLDESVEHFGAAVELDPDLAPAHAGLAQAYLLAAEHRALDPDQALRLAEEAALRAIELQPSLAEAILVSAAVAEARSDLPRAVELYERALGFDRSLAYGHERLGRVLSALGQHDEAVAAARRAQELDPGGPGARLALASAFLAAGQPGNAIAQATSALRLDDSLPEVHELLGRAHQAEGRHAEATLAYEEAIRLSGRNPRYLSRLARALADQGDLAGSRRALRELEQATPGWKVSPVDLARVVAALGEPERAHRILDLAAENREPWLAVHLAGLRLPELDAGGRLERLVLRVRTEAERAGSSRQDAAPAHDAPAHDADRELDGVLPATAKALR